MALYIYNRCSSDSQDFMQQQNCINTHLQSRGINPQKDISQSVTEKVSGTINHTERKLARLLAKCKSGDVIFISELSRLGRNMSDLFAIVAECCDKGVTIIQCKDGSRIENASIQGKALLFALSLAAEIEVASTRQRTKMALDARRKILAEQGCFISKAGRECTRLGRPRITKEEREKGVRGDNSASCLARQEAAILWKEKSKAYNRARRKHAEGWTVTRIAADLGELFDENPEDYCTPNGCRPSKGTVSKWLREANPLAVAL